jgi:hypothetical protein
MDSWADTGDAMDSEDVGGTNQGDEDMSSNHSEEWEGEDEMDVNDEEEVDSEAEYSNVSDLEESPKTQVVKLSFKDATSKNKLRQIEPSPSQPAEDDPINDETMKDKHLDDTDVPDKVDAPHSMNETKLSSPDGSSRPDFSKFLYTPPSQDAEPHHHTGPGAAQPSPSTSNHHKMNGMTILPQHTPPVNTHFQNGAARIPTPPDTAPQHPDGLR